MVCVVSVDDSVSASASGNCQGNIAVTQISRLKPEAIDHFFNGGSADNCHVVQRSEFLDSHCRHAFAKPIVLWIGLGAFQGQDQKTPQRVLRRSRLCHLHAMPREDIFGSDSQPECDCYHECDRHRQSTLAHWQGLPKVFHPTEKMGRRGHSTSSPLSWAFLGDAEPIPVRVARPFCAPKPHRRKARREERSCEGRPVPLRTGIGWPSRAWHEGRLPREGMRSKC